MTEQTSNCRIIWHQLPDATALADALSRGLQTQAQRALDDKDWVLIGLAGGSTPLPAYADFAQSPMPWPKIGLCLIDERFVPLADLQSNERNIATAFQRIHSQLAGWHGLMHEDTDIISAAELADQEIKSLQQAMDIVVLGIGADGHIASLFIESADYAAAMDVTGSASVLPIRFVDDADKVDRLSFSLPELLKAEHVMLCITGEAKRRVLQQSLDGNKPEYAIARFLRHYRHTIEIFWSPA